MDSLDKLLDHMKSVLARTYPNQFTYVPPDIGSGYMFASNEFLIKITNWGLVSVLIAGDEYVNVCVLGNSDSGSLLTNENVYGTLACIAKYLVDYRAHLQLRVDNAPTFNIGTN